MALAFTTTDKASANHGIKALVYGRAGTGKTTLCATAPAPLILSAEAGLLSLRRVSVPVIELPRGPQAITILTEAYMALKNNDARMRSFQTICLDSISEIAEAKLEQEKLKTKDGRMLYGEVATAVIAIIKDFRDLPGRNVLFTAKEGVTKSEVTGLSRIQPGAPGNQIGPALPYLFDEIFHADIGVDNNGQRFHYLRTRATPTTDAKDRSGRLDEIEFPDLARMFAKINS